MKTDKLERWKKIRAKGKSNFILYYGVLAWGVMTTALTAILAPIFSLYIFHEQYSLNGYIMQMLIFLCGFLIAGYFWGWAAWNLAEKEYSAKTGIKC